MQVAVLAGGLGTRLRGAIPEGIPKPMALIAGKPFLQHLFDHALSVGASEFLLLVGYASDTIEQHFGMNYRGVPVRYSYEETPLGTGGALAAAKSALADQFVLTNGDTFAPVDYLSLIRLLGNSSLVMCLAPADNAGRYGSVEVDGERVIDFREKGSAGAALINAGVYACHRRLLDDLPQGGAFSFESDFLQSMLSKMKPRYKCIPTEILDIGTPASYEQANKLFARG